MERDYFLNNYMSSITMFFENSNPGMGENLNNFGLKRKFN